MAAKEKNKNILLMVLFLVLVIFYQQVSANVLTNPSFEYGSTFPYSWHTYGTGSYNWISSDAHTGSKCMELGDLSSALLFQRTPAIAGETYTVSVWAKLGSGAGYATLKIEFHDITKTQMVQYAKAFNATSQWQKYSITRSAIDFADLVTASIVGEGGSTVLFDDVSIVQSEPLQNPTGNPIQGDITGDNNVEFNDIYIFANNWLDNACVTEQWCDGADIDKSHNVDFQDFAVLANNWQKKLKNILGITHVSGEYYFGSCDFLNEGADRLLELGTKVIKIWFINPPYDYPWNSNWPVMNTFVERAQSPYYVSLFNKPFNTYIMETYSIGRPDHHFIDGVTQAELQNEQLQFYQLASYLLNAYQGSGKTFILQNWEGDWAIRQCFDLTVEPTQTAIAGMIAWLNARQAGVSQARAEFVGSGVNVYHAAEINSVINSMYYGKRSNLIDSVIPYTNVDMVSYSSYESINNIYEPQILEDALNYIASQTPNSPVFGDKNIYIGEFGFAENYWSEADYQAGIINATHTALKWGCQYLVYWQLYCNELESWATAPITDNEDVRGYWLIRPDGSYAWAWDYFYGLLNPSQ